MPEPLPRILIVDDEEALMRALSNTLNDQGFQTFGYTKASAALAGLDKHGCDILLSDLMMPEMDGITLLKAALEIDPDLIGIIMTGAGAISTAVEAMKSGAFDYILKPFKLNAILPVLSRGMATRQLRRRAAALEQKVHERTIQLEAANQELEAFAHTVSHDLRAPLRHISGYAELVVESKESTFGARDREFLDHIINSCKRMSRLVEDLLAFSRLGVGQMQSVPVNMNELLASVLKEMEPDLASRNIVWKTAELPVIPGDASLLRQVLANLISNAVKYSRNRNPAGIEVGFRDGEPNETVFFVKDNGAGFDMKYSAKLFGVFQRLHRQDEFEGSGVGLANVRRIVARHGGRTWAEGQVDAGAAFYFALPRTAPPPAPAAAQQ